MSTVIVRPLIRQDLAALLAHSERVTAESGKNGNPIFAPYDHRTPWNKKGAEKSISTAWATSVTDPGWRRDWGVLEEEKVVGNLDLRASPLHSDLHRVKLGIGIESAFQNQGWGKKLMQEALTWLKTQKHIEWLDLDVFSNNERALGLYQKLGFEIIGQCSDRFRIEGVSIHDIAMTLKLRA